MLYKITYVNIIILFFELYSTEFIKENFIIYSDIHQQIIKRFCIVDLTNEDNLNTLHRILYVIFLKNLDIYSISSIYNFLF